MGRNSSNPERPKTARSQLLDLAWARLMGEDRGFLLSKRSFTTTLYQDVTDPATGKTIQVPVRDEDGNPVQSKEALRMKQQVIDSLSALEFPENPLDQLVNHLGDRNVAEITGRTRRLIRDRRTGRMEYRK